MPKDYDNDKPKRSWREIDKRKDRSKHRDENRPISSPHRQQRAESASKVYKSKLDAFFDGRGKAPEHVAQSVSSLRDISEDGALRAEALQAIKEAKTSNAVSQATSEFLEKWELPPDFDVLGQILTCSNEEHVEAAMSLLGEMLDQKRVPNRVALLEQRLRRVKTLTDDPDIQELASGLIQRVRLFS